MSIKDNVEGKNAWTALLRAEESERNSTTIWDYRKQNELETFWISDVHLGHHCCDENLFKQNLDMIVKREMPFAYLGDLVECATRESVGSGVYEQQEIVDAQVERAIELYTPAKHLLKVMIPGNHEARVFKSSGLNLTKQMARRLGVKYGGLGGFHDIKVGNQRYSVYATHGGSGATSVGGKFNSVLRLGQNIDADVIIMGHVHDTVYHSRQRIALNAKGQKENNTQHLVVNGSYLDWWDSYAQVKGYPPGNKGNAKITFYGDKRMIEVSFV
jgi:predicted phosphodiesterase